MSAPSGPSPISANRQSGWGFGGGVIGSMTRDSITAECVKSTGAPAIRPSFVFATRRDGRARPGQHHANNRLGSLVPPGDESHVPNTLHASITLYLSQYPASTSIVSPAQSAANSSPGAIKTRGAAACASQTKRPIRVAAIACVAEQGGI